MSTPSAALQAIHFALLASLLISCTSAPATPQISPLRVEHTFAALPWLERVQRCAGEVPIYFEQRSALFLQREHVDLAIRIGEPSSLPIPAYQIDQEEVLIIAHPKNPVRSLTRAQVQGLFSGSLQNWQEVGGEDAPVQVWVFPRGEDVQQVFSATLEGTPITSLARLATTPESMLRAISDDPHAIGLLTRRLLDERVRPVFTVALTPVLALMPPGSPAEALVGCLQK